jgi:hypothetical protein
VRRVRARATTRAAPRGLQPRLDQPSELLSPAKLLADVLRPRAPALAEGTLRTRQGLAALRAAAAAHLSPAGQLQVATALEVMASARFDIF